MQRSFSKLILVECGTIFNLLYKVHYQANKIELQGFNHILLKFCLTSKELIIFSESTFWCLFRDSRLSEAVASANNALASIIMTEKIEIFFLTQIFTFLRKVIDLWLLNYALCLMPCRVIEVAQLGMKNFHFWYLILILNSKTSNMKNFFSLPFSINFPPKWLLQLKIIRYFWGTSKSVSFILAMLYPILIRIFILK